MIYAIEIRTKAIIIECLLETTEMRILVHHWQYFSGRIRNENIREVQNVTRWARIRK